MNNDQLVQQVRYLKRVLLGDEVVRNEDDNVVLDSETISDIKDSLGRIEEILTGRPQN